MKRHANSAVSTFSSFLSRIKITDMAVEDEVDLLPDPGKIMILL